MAWIFLLLAGLFEIVWAFLMKASEGFTKPWPTIGTIGFMIISFGLLSISMKTLPLGTAYVIWTGIGAVGAFVVGIAVLGEPVTPMRVIGAVLIVSGLLRHGIDRRTAPLLHLVLAAVAGVEARRRRLRDARGLVSLRG